MQRGVLMHRARCAGSGSCCIGTLQPRSCPCSQAVDTDVRSVLSVMLPCMQEAIAHEYFEDIRKEASSSTGNLAALLRLSSSGDLAALDQEAVAAAAAVAGVSVGCAAAGDGGLEHQVSQVLEAELERQQHEDEDMEDWEGR